MGPRQNPGGHSSHPLRPSDECLTVLCAVIRVSGLVLPIPVSMSALFISGSRLSLENGSRDSSIPEKNSLLMRTTLGPWPSGSRNLMIEAFPSDEPIPFVAPSRPASHWMRSSFAALEIVATTSESGRTAGPDGTVGSWFLVGR